jgi:ribosomal protein S18 acetylase RimI-like enzyme
MSSMVATPGDRCNFVFVFHGRMPGMHIRRFQSADEQPVVALWHRCGLTRPWNDPNRDIRRKLGVQPELFLVATLDEQVVATVMAGYDGHRGWLYYLAVDSAQQRLGYGREIVTAAERLLANLGGPKINLQVRTDNVAVVEFYRRLGFCRDEVVSLGKRLVPDS